MMKKESTGKVRQQRVTEQPKAQGSKGSGTERRKNRPVSIVIGDETQSSKSPPNPPAAQVSENEDRNLRVYVTEWNKLSAKSFRNEYLRGQLLVRAKAGLARGQWLDFLAHARSVSNRHVQRYMRVVMQFDPHLSSHATSMSHLAAVGMTRLHLITTLSSDQWRFRDDGALQVLDGQEWVNASERSSARIRQLTFGRDALSSGLSVKQVDNLLEQWDRLVPDTEERELWLSGNLEKLPAVSRWSEEARKEIDRLALRLKKAEEFLAQVTQASRECPPSGTAEPSKPDNTSPAEQDANPAEAA